MPSYLKLQYRTSEPVRAELMTNILYVMFILYKILIFFVGWMMSINLLLVMLPGKIAPIKQTEMISFDIVVDFNQSFIYVLYSTNKCNN